MDVFFTELDAKLAFQLYLIYMIMRLDFHPW